MLNYSKKLCKVYSDIARPELSLEDIKSCPSLNQLCDGLGRYKDQVQSKSRDSKRENIAVIGSRSSLSHEAAQEGVNRVTREEMKIVVSREAVVKDDYNNLIAKSCNEMSVDC